MQSRLVRKTKFAMSRTTMHRVKSLSAAARRPLNGQSKLALSAVQSEALALPVSAPFHCALMQPAADAIEKALAETTIAPPSVPIIANVSADEARDPDETIRTNLVSQVTARVRWRESVLCLKDKGVDTLVEAGAGKG